MLMWRVSHVAFHSHWGGNRPTWSGLSGLSRRFARARRAQADVPGVDVQTLDPAAAVRVVGRAAGIPDPGSVFRHAEMGGAIEARAGVNGPGFSPWNIAARRAQDPAPFAPSPPPQTTDLWKRPTKTPRAGGHPKSPCAGPVSAGRRRAGGPGTPRPACDAQSVC